MSAQELIAKLNRPALLVWPRQFGGYLNLRSFSRRQTISLSTKIAKIRTTLKRWYVTQYFLARVWKDIKTGIKHNEDINVGVLFISSVLCVGVAALATEILYIFFNASLFLVDTMGVDIVTIGAITGAVFVICMTWMAAFLLNSVSLALMQGLNRTYYTSILRTLRCGLYAASQTVLAWLAYLLVMFVPLFVVAGLLGLTVLTELISFDQAVLASPYLIIAGIAWVLIILIQYSLMPIVAMYEHDKSLTQAFGRAHELVIGRGRIFTLALFWIFVGAIASIGLLASFLEKTIGISYEFIMTLTGSLAAVLWTMFLTALYKKRKHAVACRRKTEEPVKTTEDEDRTPRRNPYWMLP